MKIIGIIGGVGSGKSEITKYIANHFNAYIIIADEVGHEVLKKDTIAYRAIVQKFGNCILTADKEINRKALGNIVFNDKKALEWLNNTTHPLIYNRVTDRINEAKSKDYDIIIFEAAIMVEAKWLGLVDYVWLITSSEEIRIERLMKYRHLTLEKIKNIMMNQQSDAYLEKFADVIIDNSYTLEETLKRVYIEITKVLEDHNENI